MRESFSEPVAVEDRRDSTRRMGLRDAIRAAYSGVGVAGKRPPLSWEAGIGFISRTLTKSGSMEPSRVVPRVNPSSLH